MSADLELTAGGPAEHALDCRADGDERTGDDKELVPGIAWSSLRRRGDRG